MLLQNVRHHVFETHCIKMHALAVNRWSVNRKVSV